ncbi:uncharacterized protein LOC133780147 [Humulus lupulus]|uniref:uncharacterized protein LOC133780147 n=1 Tax=Humulus lupulus TaxID=3486 RepID=UPI002B415DBD|nr:uncharacterized protein LOC133780147 [Humulus lupulus]
MAEKINQQANGYTRSDEESATSQSKELKRKKRIKLAIYIAIFAVFQIIVITVFGAVIMRAKSPMLRLSNSIEFQKCNVSSSSFDITFATQVRVKNSNFGRYKFDNTTAVFTYGSATVELPTSAADVLSREFAAGMLTFSGEARMNGKVELMWIMKKKKSANLNCTVIIDVNEKKLRSLECK